MEMTPDITKMFRVRQETKWNTLIQQDTELIRAAEVMSEQRKALARMHDEVILGGMIKQEMIGVAFTNGSTVYAGTSLRGGTLHILHLSELGSIAAYSPKKATEIMTDGYNTVAKSGIFIKESTLDDEQKVWYESMARTQGYLMRQEYPQPKCSTTSSMKKMSEPKQRFQRHIRRPA